MSITVDKLNAGLLGESEFDLLARGDIQFGLAFGNGHGGILDLGDLDGPLLGEIFTAHDGKVDGLVDTGLDGLGVLDIDGDIDGGDDGHVVSGFLGDLVAVVVSITTISMVSGLADGDHLDIGFLLEGDLNGLASGGFSFLLVVVRADLLGDHFDGFSTDGAGHGVCEVNIDDDFDGQFDIFANGLEGRGADLSGFSHIMNGAVVFRFLITITSISRGVVSIGGGSVAVGGGMMNGGMVNGMMTGIRGSGGNMAVEGRSMDGVGGAGGHEGEESQNSESLHDVFCLS